jgi:hypothetical protein
MLGNVRRVDAQDSDRVGRAVGELDHDGVAVEHFEHPDPWRCGPALLPRPPPQRGGHDHNYQRRDGAPGDHGAPDTVIQP